MKCLLPLLLVALLIPSSRGEIILHGKTWDVAIQPETLAADARPKRGQAVAISSPSPARIVDLKSDQTRASWSIPDHHVTASFRLEDDVLIVSFKADQPGTFTWPILAPAERRDGFVLPMFEGLYVPADDELFAKFLVKEGSLNTTAGLSMPFWGTRSANRTLTYVLTNAFNNEMTFQLQNSRLGLSLAHEFTRNQPVKEFGYHISFGGDSPVEPAKVYRRFLRDTGQFASFEKKKNHVPDAELLLGAAHFYLWGDNIIARKDIRDYKALASRLVDAGKSPDESVAQRTWKLLSEETRKLLGELSTAQFVDRYQKGIIADDLTRVLKRSDLLAKYDKQDTSSVARANCLALQAAFSDIVDLPDSWGDGFSTRMLEALHDGGIDRAWLGSPTWDGLRYHEMTVRKARELHYLIGPYDSYHSIHPQNATDTWETAQFDDPNLYEAGAIVNADGKKRAGFKQIGHTLSPAAVRPHLEKRVAELMKQFRCNSWFMDCDAFGEVFDDYSPAHPMTQAQDAAERVSRMGWIRDTYQCVIGSEGGSAYAAPVIHFSHGIMTPVIAWGDVDMMKDKTSKYYLGAYWPPDEPAMAFKQVPLKEEYRRVYADPRFRLPLYETVFHDSVIATHEWGYGSLKFDDPGHARELLEMLYNVPPLYHLNLAEWARRKDEIKRRYAFFSPVHREFGLLPMTDFRWLSDDRMIQQVRFGEDFELTANFRDTSFLQDAVELPARSILLRRLKGGGVFLYRAGD